MKIAASVIARLVDLSMPVGLAANGAQTMVLRPDSSPQHLGRLMEVLAQVRADGPDSLERFLYDMRPQLSRFNTVTIITPSSRPDWVPALQTLRRQGVNLSVVLIDPQSFGHHTGIQLPLQSLSNFDMPSYVVRRGQVLNEALTSSVELQSQLAAAPGEVTASGTAA